MGILNVTPDSFSDGNELPTLQAVVDRAGQMITEGADVLDIGGESTRPGASAVSAAEELARVLPAIAAIRQGWPHVPISIDTSKAEVAAVAVRAGADIVNDVWGLTHELAAAERDHWRRIARTTDTVRGPWPAPTRMAATVSALGCPVIAMHNRLAADYRDFWDDLLLDLQVSLALAAAAGIAPHQVWLDPGFGFAKDVAQNLAIVRDLGRVVGLGYPVLLGTSRKSTIGRVLDADISDRLDGTGATIVWGIQQGCQMVRVHDVAAMRRYVRMADALKQGLDFSP
jgi:dihydropteroate synthase